MPPSTTLSSRIHSLIQELQILWDEIGDSSSSRSKIECLGLYNEKVEQTRAYIVELLKSLADDEAEVARLLSDAEAEVARLISAPGEQVSLSGKVLDETGESYNSRDKMLLEFELESLDLYDKKVEETRKYRDELQRSLGDAEDEVASLMSAPGEQVSRSREEVLTETAKMHKLWKRLGTPQAERRKLNHISRLLSLKADDATPGMEIVGEVQEELRRLNSNAMVLSEAKEEVLNCRRAVPTAEDPTAQNRLVLDDVPQPSVWEEAILYVDKVIVKLEKLRKTFRQVGNFEGEKIPEELNSIIDMLANVLTTE